MPAYEQPDKWFSLNEAAIIDVMIADRDSDHWQTCSDFVRYYLGKQFPNLPPQRKEEVVQDTLFAVCKALPSFRRQSKLTTWIVSIAYHRAIDMLRRLSTIEQTEIAPGESLDPHENEFERAALVLPKTPEEIILTEELLRETFAGIEAFLQMHKKSRRNRVILSLVLIDGLSQKETARKLGIPAPVVGAVVRAARAYLRQRLSYMLEEED